MIATRPRAAAVISSMMVRLLAKYAIPSDGGRRRHGEHVEPKRDRDKLDDAQSSKCNGNACGHFADITAAAR
jgi:hypothetical protein